MGQGGLENLNGKYQEDMGQVRLEHRENQGQGEIIPNKVCFLPKNTISLQCQKP